jgi:pilus assembly protein TadC
MVQSIQQSIHDAQRRERGLTLYKYKYNTIQIKYFVFCCISYFTFTFATVKLQATDLFCDPVVKAVSL